MSLPAKRGRPILPKVRTKTASVMMVVDGCGNSLVKIELFHLFYCRDAVNLLQHNKHGLVVINVSSSPQNSGAWRLPISVP